jgi:inhibitor of KinA sporulation pathway (predicted exonuclease)
MSTKRLDCALVIDVESTCWDHEPPRGQSSEIIEVGLCLVDLQQLERRERRSILVRPQMSEVSEFCTRLTGITSAMLRDAPPLAEAIRILRDEYDLKYPFGPTHLNVKNLFSLALGLTSELGIDAACARMGLTMEGAHHRGVDDAWNIAQIFCLLLKRTRRAGM